jgi:S-adenosylmethionine hydrolase
VDVEEPFAYIDAADHVALAVNHGSASANLGLVAGDPVTLSMPAAGSGVVDGGVDAIA